MEKCNGNGERVPSSQRRQDAFGESPRKDRRCKSWTNAGGAKLDFVTASKNKLQHSASLNASVQPVDDSNDKPKLRRSTSLQPSVSNNIDELIRQSSKERRRRSSVMSVPSYAISKEMQVRIRSQNRFALHGEWLLYWDIVLFACLIFVGLSEPVILAFDVKETWCHYSSIMISTIYMTDTIMNFFRAQKVPTREGSALVTDIRVLSKNYFCGMFIIDLISALPLGLILGYRWRLVIVLRMLRFIHTWRLMQNVQKLTSWSYSVLDMCEFTIILLLVVHWIACAWSRMQRSASESWLTQLKVKLKDDGCDTNFDSIADEYLLSLYWAVTVISSVGFGDITPVTNSEILCAQICMAIGGGVWAYIVGSVCSIAFTMDKHRNSFENLMNDVREICRERHLPKDLQTRVREYFKNARDFIRMKEHHATVHELSPALKGEVIKFMYGSHFRRVWYFDVVDDYTALLLVENLVPMMYAREELIEASIDRCRALVFLRSGVCVRKCNVLAPGAVWGLDVILGSEEHDDIEHLLDTANARSITFAMVLKLSKHGIDHAARLVPAFAKRLRKAHLRMLLWRGIIAASRAMTRINKPATVKQSGWDKLGKLVGKVIHRERLMLDPIRRESGVGSMSLHPIRRNSGCESMHLQMERQSSKNNGLSQAIISRQTSDEGSRPATPRALDISQDESCRPMRGSSKSTPVLPLPHLRTKEQPPPDTSRASDGTSGQQSQPRAPLIKSWKSEIERKIKSSDEKLTTMQANMSEELAAISDEVAELTRMMHQVLGKLDAEEHY